MSETQTIRTASPARIIVDRRGAARVAAGHPWVYANELKDDLKKFVPAQQVELADQKGRVLGYGFVNPRSLIAVRVLSRKPSTFDAMFFAERLALADAWRRRYRPGTTAYRLCYGESDDLPGLVIDRFDDVYVVQSHAAGIDAMTEAIVEGLVKAFSPRGVLLKYDSSARKLEGVGVRIDVVHGEVPEELAIAMEGSKFVLDLRKGQKTGFFHDQAPNRARLADYTKGRGWIGMLVRVKNITLQKDAAPDKNGRIAVELTPPDPNAKFACVAPFPKPPSLTNDLFDLGALGLKQGATVKAIVGVVGFFCNLKLAPRSVADITR